MLLYSVIVAPYNSKLANLSLCITEASILVLSLIYTKFRMLDRDNSVVIYGNPETNTGRLRNHRVCAVFSTGKPHIDSCKYFYAN